MRYLELFTHLQRRVTGEDDKIFMAKFDVKDGFWRLDCEAGEEWNFAYVLPQHEGGLVVPTSFLADGMGGITTLYYFVQPARQPAT
jgi:hypothetical protein